MISLWLRLLLAVHGTPEPLLLVQDPALLGELPLPLGKFLAAPAARQNEALYSASPLYRSLVESLDGDLRSLKAQDSKLGPTMAHSHRLFDVRWLRSPIAQFELVGVVNRLDRRPFHPDRCGEVRLVYRLAYDKGNGLRSRLPMTVNVVHWMPSPCGGAARRWLRPEGAFGSWATGAGGPLAADVLASAQLKAVEVNVQSVRWPSTIRPDLGGHAEYFLRVFHRKGDRLVPAPLENTPDVERLRPGSVARKDLLAFLKAPAQLQAIDAGVLQIPDRFLTSKATSVSPRGLHRAANRPFSRIFTERDFSDVSFKGNTHVRSAAALLRRLDDLSCVGCHQGRTVAGFHLLGLDGSTTLAANAIAVTGSPHLLGDQPRRLAYMNDVLAGKEGTVARPFSERSDVGEGGFGSHCGLGDPGFAHWTCGEGLGCQSLGGEKGEDEVGFCLPKEPVPGGPCESGTLVPNADPHRDRLTGVKASSCGAGVCEVNRVGFPDGMCAFPCGAGRGERCGSIAILQGFNDCLGAGRPFPTCLEQNVRPAGLRPCGDADPCRDDYLCARGPEGGVCLPPYFLFQMRVDGHPRP